MGSMYPAFSEQQPTTASPVDEAPIRPTRKQVSRACDWCRARRIKCDNGRPCRACRQRSAQCTHKGTDEPRTLPQALREIERLKAQNKELQAELSSRDRPSLQAAPTPSETATTSPPATKEGRGVSRSCSQASSSYPTPSAEVTTKPQWVGVHVATSRFDDRPSYYGPSSHFYYLTRIGAYLEKTLDRPYTTRSMQPVGEARRKATFPEVKVDQLSPLDKQPSGAAQLMNRRQEEYFLGLFWESYHCLLPILDEVDFRAHYASLWEPGKEERSPSPLVDMVLAVCLQYGYTFLPDLPQTSGQATCDDVTVAGRSYYHRSQALLVTELESPTIATVQCLTFSVAFLCCASFLNMSHAVLAQTIRLAQILGLHLEPPADVPLHQRELRKRIWWCLWCYDMKTTTKLGRPVTADRSAVTITLPSDGLEAATANGATLGAFGNVTWLTYTVQMDRLVFINLDMHQGLYAKFGETLKNYGASSPYEDPRMLEHCAEFLASQLPALKMWVDQVPSDLKTPRRQGGEAFSQDRTPLHLDPLVPTWLMRQRISAEVMYNTLAVNLTRPFITFSRDGATYTPVSERLVSTCINHAITQVLIMHQVVTESDTMAGWSEYFFWHWNAMVTLAGFILAYPVHRSTPSARSALDKGLAVFGVYSEKFAIAGDTAKIVVNLVRNADLLAERVRGGTLKGGATPTTPTTTATTTTTTAPPPLQQQQQQQQQPVAGPIAQETTAAAGDGGGAQNATAADDGLSWLDASEQNDPAYLDEFMDWAFSVDQFNSFERFFEGSNPSGAGAWTGTGMDGFQGAGAM